MSGNIPQPRERQLATSARIRQISSADIVNAAVSLLGTHRSVSSLGLREIARAANIAPNSFYRHFRDVDELTVALIDQAGRSLRGIIREARLRLSPERSAIRTSVEVFMDQLDSEDKYLEILLREMSVGSDAFRHAADRELSHFEDELCEELIRIQTEIGANTYQPALAAKAITRLVFAMGVTAVDASEEQRTEITEQTVIMLRMIMTGAQTLAKQS
jgi:AcrR family transcriptional regulator